MNWNPSWANAIASIESQGSGGYSAVGPTTQKGNRAYGKYQVMDFNIPTWTEKHLGQRLTPDQFLNSPEAQEAVFKGEFGSYVSKYGNPQDAASAWFTGRPQSEGGNRSDALGTTGSGYVSKFNNALGTGATLTGGQPMMQPEQKPKGLLGGLFSNPDKRARLAMALEGMTLNPNRGMMASLQGGIEQRGLDRKEAAAEAKQLAQRNKSLEFLAQQEGGEDYVRLAQAAGVPTAIKAYLENKKAPKSTTAQDKIARLKSTGVPENIAIGITDGRLVVRQNDVTGETFVLDVATGQKVFDATGAGGNEVPIDQPASITDEGSLAGLDPTKALAARGYANSWLNAAADTFGQKLPAPEAAKASAAMRSLATRTIALAETEFAGKPTNFLRERVEQNFSINPDQISMGPRVALERSNVIIDMLQETVDGAKAVIAGGTATVNAKKSAMDSLPKSEALLRDYISLREALNSNLGNNNGPVQITPTQNNLMDLYAPEKD